MSRYEIDIYEPYRKINWEQANCRQLGTNAFYIQDDQDRREQLPKTQYARQVCVTCPIQRECLVYAFKHERYGMWGAMTARERNFIATNKLGGNIVKLGLFELNSLGVSMKEVYSALRESNE